MPVYDIWSDDAAQRSMALQDRSDAVTNDRSPSVDAMAPMEELPKPEGVLLRRIEDGWVILANDDEAELLIASGEYRPLAADDRWTENGTFTDSADAKHVEEGRKERIRALATLMREREQERAVISSEEEVETRIRSMSDEEQAALEQSLIEPIAGLGKGLVRAPVAD